DRAGFEKTVAKLRAPMATGADVPLAARTAAKGLFLNDRAAEGVALLIDKHQYLPAFEVLAAQWKYREAFELYDRLSKEEGMHALALDLRRAQYLYQLGEKEQALALLARKAAALKAEGDLTRYRELIRIEKRLG